MNVGELQVIFCSLQQLGPFDIVLRKCTNISPDCAVWYRTNATGTNQYLSGYASAAEGIKLQPNGA